MSLAVFAGRGFGEGPATFPWSLPRRRRGPGFGAPRQHPSEGRGLTALVACSNQKSGEPSEREEAHGARCTLGGGSCQLATSASLTPASHSPGEDRQTSFQPQGHCLQVGAPARPAGVERLGVEASTPQVGDAGWQRTSTACHRE